MCTHCMHTCIKRHMHTHYAHLLHLCLVHHLVLCLQFLTVRCTRKHPFSQWTGHFFLLLTRDPERQMPMIRTRMVLLSCRMSPRRGGYVCVNIVRFLLGETETYHPGLLLKHWLEQSVSPSLPCLEFQQSGLCVLHNHFRGRRNR